ncbi:TonB-dependent receptor domain-containing protein, partial [candidate division KSB1 bacterium]
EGSVLTNVNIQVEGTDIGTVSGADGTFILKNIPAGEKTLIASHILYKTEKIKVFVIDNGSNNITIRFKENRSFSLSEVVVTATKFEIEPEKVPQSVSLITSEEIEKRHYYNVGEMLDYVPGVRIIRSGTVGASNGVSIRSLNGGPASSKSLVLVDGKPMNDGWDGGVNWHTIPTDMVERVEVVKGPGSALYGSQATGGVINVFTKSPASGFHGWVSYGYEMNASVDISDKNAEGYGRADVSASNLRFNGSYGADNTNHIMSIGYRNSNQSFPTPNKNKWKNYDIKYKMNHRYSETLSSRLSFDIHNNTWRNEASKSPDEASTDFYSIDSYTKWQTKTGVFTNRAYINYSDYSNTVLSADLKTGSKTYRLGLISDYTIPFINNNASLKFGLDASYDYADVNYEKAVMDMTYLEVQTVMVKDKKTGQIYPVQADLYRGIYGSSAQDYNLHNLALFAQYNQILAEKLNIVLGGRFDNHSEFGSIFNPKLGAALEVFNINNFTTSLKVNYGTGFRAPNMRALYSKSLDGFGHLDLIPEKTKNFDIGIFERLGDFGFIELSFFKMDVKNLLINDKLGSTGEGNYVVINNDTLSFNNRKNLGDYSPSGLELGFRIRPHRQITLMGAYSYLDPQDFTFQTSKNRYNLGISAYQQIGKNRLEAEIRYNYTGDGYFFDYKSSPYDAFVLTDGRITFDFQNNLRISLHGKNLLDKKYKLWHYAWQPGRTFVLQIATKF